MKIEISNEELTTLIYTLSAAKYYNYFNDEFKKKIAKLDKKITHISDEQYKNEIPYVLIRQNGFMGSIETLETWGYNNALEEFEEEGYDIMAEIMLRKNVIDIGEG